jgi:carbohydrate diacid regulator
VRCRSLAAPGQTARQRLLGVVASGLRRRPDWPVLRGTIVAWCEGGFSLVRAAAGGFSLVRAAAGGFSLVRAAAAPHIHRNTLVYRLDKIERLTGRPLRDHRATLALYLACLADQLDADPAEA